MGAFHDRVRDRLVRYAAVDTQSDRLSKTTPTTMKQFDLARMLERELREIGVSDVWLDEDKCVVYGRLPSNLPEGRGTPTGFIAHMDTAPDAPGSPVRPWVLEHYDGGDIVLNREKNIVMRTKDFPNLLKYVGQDLVMTDGQTLLGGDDKASIAAIMTMAEHLAAHPEIPHAQISLAFTPDEEVAGLAKDLDLARFGAPTAYTLDGDWVGYYEDETFNASEAHITFTGRSVHPGTAKGIMVNAVDMGAQFMAMLPQHEKPQYTEGREGFYHIVSFSGDCEKAELYMIIRDHDASAFAAREECVRSLCEVLAARYGAERVSCRIEETYRSMKEVTDKVPFTVDLLRQAIRECGVEPRSFPFRGGTDGSALSHRGLPCPNLSAGYENAHGRFEYVPVQSMEKNVEILLRLAALYAERDA